MTDLEQSYYLLYDKLFSDSQQGVMKDSLAKKTKKSFRIVDMMIIAVSCYDASVIFLQSDPIKLRTVSLEYVEEIIFESHYVAVISLRRQLLVDAIPAVLYALHREHFQKQSKKTPKDCWHK